MAASSAKPAGQPRKGRVLAVRDVLMPIAFLVGLVLALAASPSANAHATSEASSLAAKTGVAFRHVAPMAMIAFDKDATAHLGRAEALLLEPVGPVPGDHPCDHGCCCYGMSSCVSCCGAATPVESSRPCFALGVVVVRPTTAEVMRSALPLPVDPPPRPVI